MRRIATFVSLSLLVTGLSFLGSSLTDPDTALGATPDSGTVSAKRQGSDTINYKGEVPPGSGSLAECREGVNADVFRLTVEGTSAKFYETHSATLVVNIRWDPRAPNGALNDLALIVQKGGETLAESDGGVPEESVSLDRPTAGRYKVITCDFANATPQPYLGDATLTSARLAGTTLPKASKARGLKFSPIVTVDPQRDVAEPSLRIDKAGNYYTCGPFGASRGAEYATKSQDGGDTFRVLGEPPEGRLAPGGGGDCDLSVAPKKNEEGNYNLTYTGLEALLNFSTGVSQNHGKTFTSTSTSEAVPVVDRQFLESTGSEEVYLFYNQIPFGGTLQRSTNAGLTYELASEQGNAAPNINRPGNIAIDPNRAHNVDNKNNETVYIAYTNGMKVMVSRSSDQGQTFDQLTVAKGKGRPDTLFPSIALDRRGNLYVTWVEQGSFNTYYSYSKDQGRTWARKQLVNRRGANTTVMPWVAAGSPGRIAISTYCTPVDGNPNVGSFRGPWNVCVNQSLNALGGNAKFSQVKVASHPIHWDSICLNGLGCNVSQPPGDRTLLDFFQIQMDPRNGRVSTVFNESNKYPRAELGPIAIVNFAQQKSGPSLLKKEGRVRPDRRPNVRSRSRDPKGDAKFDFSSLNPTPPPRRTNQKALDFKRVRLSRASIKGKRAILFKLKLRDLSDTALLTAAANLDAQELKFVVRWFSAYRPDYAIASYVPGVGFEFGAGHLKAERGEITPDGKLETYPAPGRIRIPGKVDQEKGIITMKVPYRFIQDFDLGKKLIAKPSLGPARKGDKIYEVTAWTFGRVAPENAPGDYYNQADSTPSFDYRLK
ncbi:MAG: glycoside hydrolase [Actinomycetota bacterium]|nr:glycoside hydrolase [Actinomycetota bacterium]